MDARNKAIELTKENLDSLKNHLADALGVWMLENMPGNIVHKIVWRLEDTHVGITSKTSTTWRRARKVGIPSSGAETIIAERDTAKMLEKALKR